MNNRKPIQRPAVRPVPRRHPWRAAAAAFCATMLAWPAAANFDVPNDPLTTGSRVPPNIMFILDNSGSMALISMPTLPEDFDVQPIGYSGTGTGASRTGLRDDPHDRSYLNNGVYYNPAVTYQPWMTADGVTRMTGGTSVSAAYSNWNLASGSTIDLRGSTESVFYVPHAGVQASTSPSPTDYDRYSINSAGEVVRSVYSRPTANPGLPAGPYSSSNGNVVATVNITVPTGTEILQVFTTGGNSRVRLDLYRNGNVECTSQNGNGGESCSVSDPASGTWQATLRRDGSGGNANFTGVRIDAQVDVPTPAVPNASRTQAQELANFATWYSYFRTRFKTAKAGASEAFSGLSNELRVGYTPINGSSSHLSATGTQAIIPVNSNNGLFESNNRTNWFTSMQSEVVSAGSTPLRTTLKAVGDYYTRSDTNGPWGPGALASQLSCRQSFSILTTDGYWNDSNPSGIGDSDGDGNGPTLGDVADFYYKNDLRDNLSNNVPTSNADPANWQHMVTFGLSIGLRGNMQITNPPPASNSPLWTNPMDGEDADRIDDLWHAAVNSKGRFVAASDPQAFSQGLQSALAAIVERTGSFSNVAANSTTLDAGSRVYQANYVSSVWTGELRSQPVTVAGGVQAVDCSGAAQPSVGWCASKGIPTTGRNVFTSDGRYHNDGSGTPALDATTANQPARAFPDQATSGQLSSLTRPGVTGANNAAYIAGARTLEESQTNGYLRNRNHLLGDIIGSSPAYVPGTGGSAGTVYIGANDGMLHAFDAANGNELFAYIPGIINWHNLASLSRPDYGHRYFVDGPIVVSSRQQTPNQNILVGALGKGGKGLFALDVTNPSTFGTGNNVKWERAETPLGNMGLVQGRPLLATVPDTGTGTNAVVLGNGVNSTNGRAALIVLNLDTGAVIREIAVGTAGVPNGLSAPTGVLGADGRTLSYVYAGDMLGNVWKFDLTNTNAASWTATRLFTATNAANQAQPISGAVTVATHPRSNQRWVFFGTGRYLTTADVASTAVQSMYGFVDDGTAIVRSGTGANLTQRTIQVTNQTSNGFPVRGFEVSTPLPPDSKGWYIDLPASGERIVQDAQVVSTFLITASVIPSGDACESGGSGFINALDAFSGTSAGGSYFNLDGNGGTNEVVGDPARPVGSVNVGGGMPTLPNLLRGRFVVGGSGGSDVRGTQTLAPRWDRASWREIRGE
jgi:type IV pilus assembly protein PilY1